VDNNKEDNNNDNDNDVPTTESQTEVVSHDRTSWYGAAPTVAVAAVLVAVADAVILLRNFSSTRERRKGLSLLFSVRFVYVR